MDQNDNIVETYLDDSDGYDKCKVCNGIISEESILHGQRHFCTGIIYRLIHTQHSQETVKN